MLKLKELEKAVDKFDNLGNKFLLPGLSKNKIEKYSEEQPLIFQESLVQVYQWRNGQYWNDEHKYGERWFFPGYFFYEMEHALVSIGAMLAILNIGIWVFSPYSEILIFIC